MQSSIALLANPCIPTVLQASPTRRSRLAALQLTTKISGVSRHKNISNNVFSFGHQRAVAEAGVNATWRKRKTLRRTQMIRLFNTLARLHKDEAGQGLVEYVLIVALIAFGAVAGMTDVAIALNSAFNAIGSKVGQYIT
jgi:Flp pilus assembly pilin Flp